MVYKMTTQPGNINDLHNNIYSDGLDKHEIVSILGEENGLPSSNGGRPTPAPTSKSISSIKDGRKCCQLQLYSKNAT